MREMYNEQFFNHQISITFTCVYVHFNLLNKHLAGVQIGFYCVKFCSCILMRE